MLFASSSFRINACRLCTDHRLAGRHSKATTTAKTNTRNIGKSRGTRPKAAEVMIRRTGLIQPSSDVRRKVVALPPEASLLPESLVLENREARQAQAQPKGLATQDRSQLFGAKRPMRTWPRTVPSGKLSMTTPQTSALQSIIKHM